MNGKSDSRERPQEWVFRKCTHNVGIVDVFRIRLKDTKKVPPKMHITKVIVKSEPIKLNQMIGKYCQIGKV